MKMMDEYIKLPKDMIYEQYLRIVYDNKDYDKISRKKMITEIIEMYKEKYFLYSICTLRELEFLQKFHNKKITQKDYQKYEWEIKELEKKWIISGVTFEVFEEQKENVQEALNDLNKELKRREDNIIIFIISNVKIYSEMLTKALASFMEDLFKMPKEVLNSTLGHPLIHFYCDFYYRTIDGLGEEEIIYYRDYYDLLPDVFEERKKFGIATTVPIDLDNYNDIFYYGFPIKNPKVKKMYDVIKKQSLPEFLFQVIDEARVLNYRSSLNFMGLDDEILEIINEALDEMPCSVMNGASPKQYEEEKTKEKVLNKRLPRVSQNNAHLCKKAADLYYKLYLGLLDYVNKKENINPLLTKIANPKNLNPHDLVGIDEYLWNHKDIIDEFCANNPYDFNEEELSIVKGFKTAIMDRFIIAGFEREYTYFIDKTEKIYMVKGIRTDIDRLISYEKLPIIVNTTLLMFKDQIIYNSFLTYPPIEYGSGLKEAVLKELEKGIKYYHL